MIPSIMCYLHVSPFVKLLGPTTPNFQIRIHDPHISNKIDAHDAVFLPMQLYAYCNACPVINERYFDDRHKCSNKFEILKVKYQYIKNFHLLSY